MERSPRLLARFLGCRVKVLSRADLGKSQGNQTHIGLLKDTFDGWDAPRKYDAGVYYAGHAFPCLAFVDPITNPDGSVRSPKLRRGLDHELGNAESALLIIRSLAQPGDGLAVFCSLGRMDFLVIPSAEMDSADFKLVSRSHLVGIAAPRANSDSSSFVYRQDPSDAIGVAMEGESETVIARRRKRNEELRDPMLPNMATAAGPAAC